MKTKIGCVVMAAGGARRFGRNKLLSPLDGVTLAQRAIDAVPLEKLHSAVVVTGYPEIVARDVTKIKPLIEFDSTYSKRGLHWQTFCIDNGKAYFLNMGDVPESSIVKHDTYVEVYDLKTGKLLREKVRQEYIQDVGGLASRGYVESDYCYVEPEGIKVMGDTMYILYTCRGNKNLTTRRPVIFKLSSDI